MFGVYPAIDTATALDSMLNGILLTSTEPDRKTFSFDLFPSQIIDNIIINKAFNNIFSL